MSVKVLCPPPITPKCTTTQLKLRKRPLTLESKAADQRNMIQTSNNTAASQLTAQQRYASFFPLLWVMLCYESCIQLAATNSIVWSRGNWGALSSFLSGFGGKVLWNCNFLLYLILRMFVVTFKLFVDPLFLPIFSPTQKLSNSICLGVKLKNKSGFLSEFMKISK